MPEIITSYILRHGYLTLFSLGFLTEIGIPNPLPNEFVLLFVGYLSSQGQLNIILAIAVITFADFMGTSLLYAVFYFLGEKIMNSRVKWIPRAKIRKVAEHIEENGKWSLYLTRLLPYARIYTSVAAGFLDIQPRVFLPIIFMSALTWGSGYIVAGRLLGNKYAEVIHALSGREIAAGAVLVFILVFFTIPYIITGIKNRKKKKL